MSDLPSSQESEPSKPVIKRKPVLIRKPAQTTVVRRQSEPVKVGAGNTSPKPLKLNKASEPTKVRKPAEPRIGKPDFSSSIITPQKAAKMRKKTHVSTGQLIFFDASIALIAVSFMLLVIVRL